MKSLSLATRLLLQNILALVILISAVLAITYYTVDKDLSTLMLQQQRDKLNTMERVLLSYGKITSREGKLYAGEVQLDGNLALVDELKKRLNAEVTIFTGDTRSATTIYKDGKRLLGTKLAGVAKEHAIDRKVEYHGNAMVVGLPFLGSYLPVMDENGAYIGCLFLGTAISTFHGMVYQAMGHILMVAVPVALLMVWASWWLMRRSLRKVSEVEEVICRTIANIRGIEQEILKVSSATLEVADNNARDAESVSMGSTQTNAQMESVAAATNQLSHSVDEILKHVNHMTGTVVSNADARVSEAVEATRQLEQASANIENVMALITAIAEQTNLLALNASIEAARAGDAGRGFAVVADEVKKLASQTADATSSIGGEIKDMQSKTGHTVSAIETIRVALGDISEIASAVSRSVNEQTQATQDIGNSLNETSVGVQQIAQGVASITTSAGTTHQLAEQVKQQLEQLDEQTGLLTHQVGELQQVFYGKATRSARGLQAAVKARPAA